MIVLESSLRSSVLKYLRKRYPRGWWTGTVGTAALGGLPDVMGTCPEVGGRIVAIELKVGDNKTSKLQAWVLDHVRHADGIAGVAYDLDGVAAIMSEGERRWQSDKRPSTW